MIRNEAEVVVGVLHSAMHEDKAFFFLYYFHLKKGIAMLFDKKAKES